MIAEQTVTCRYKASALQTADVEIQMTVRLERRPELYGDVEIGHEYEQIFPDFDLWDMLFQRMNNGVHGGYALSGVPYIPETILSVKILELKVSPLPQTIEEATDKFNLGYLLEVTVGGIVESLCRSLEHLRSDKESHVDWPESPPDGDEEND